MKKIDWNTYRFRASQVSKICAGTIGATEKEKQELEGLVQRKKAAAAGELDDKGKPVRPLTQNMEDRIVEIQTKENNKEIPKTMRSELRKIWRAETYGRNFVYTNKYIQKGLIQEEESITLFQRYRTKVLGIPTLFSKNTERLTNDWFSGEWDLPDLTTIKNTGEGYDIKTSWDLDTFPFKDDPLEDQYMCQAQAYMDLSGAKKWYIVHCLVNNSEHGVHNEKLKFYYANQQPENSDDLYYDKYIQEVRDIEKKMIFDYDRFVDQWPAHIMQITKEEWHGEGWDIPMEDRVVIREVEYSPDTISEMKNRISIAREYLKSL